MDSFPLLDEDEIPWLFHTRKAELKKDFKRFVAEMLGLMILTVISEISGIVTLLTEKDTLKELSTLSNACALTALIFAAGQISGAHFNPVITLAFFIRREFRWWRVPMYWTAQFLGSVIAGGLVYSVFGTLKQVGANMPHNVTDVQAFALEAFFTLCTVYTTLNVSERAQVIGPNAALASGAIYAAIGLVGGSLTGASMNPFKSLGPALWAGKGALAKYWIYLCGPLVGTILAVAFVYILAAHPNPKAETKATGRGDAVEVVPITSE
jgi:aquaporin Z